LNVQEIFALDRFLPTLVSEITWYIEDDDNRNEFLTQLRDSLDSFPGETRVKFALKNGDDKFLIAETAGSLCLHPTPQNLDLLNQHPGVLGVEYELADIPVYEKSY
jgi:hypothetical protein